MWKIAALAICALAANASAASAQLPPAATKAEDNTRTDRNLLTRGGIAAREGETLLDVVKRMRPTWLLWDARFGAPQVYVDSVPRGMPSVLENIPAAAVEWVQFSDAREAHVRFGTRVPNGVIYVSTETPVSSAPAALPPLPAFDSRISVSASTHAMLTLGRGSFYAGTNARPGLAVDVAAPVGARSTYTARFSWGRVARHPNRFGPDGSSDGSSMLSATIGMKRHMGESRHSAPYFVVALGAFRGVNDIRAERVGVGATVGAGMDVKVAQSLVVFSEADLSIARFSANVGGSYGGVRVGVSRLIGVAGGTR